LVINEALADFHKRLVIHRRLTLSRHKHNLTTVEQQEKQQNNPF
jgi:hypothetical protein